MYNQTEAILSQYEIEIQEVTKGRNCFICDTNMGKLALVPFRGSQEKGMQFCRFLSKLREKNFCAEQIILTQSQVAVAEDEYTGERFILKTYVEGNEISTSRLEDMKEAVRILAIYHNAADGLEIEELAQKPNEVTETCQRHYKELIKVRNYIRNRKKKSDFEKLYMKHFEHYRSSAEESLLMLEDNTQKLFCHGDFNQHNVLISNGEYKIVNFENYIYSWPMTDLANFLRKMLEKNAWDMQKGLDLIAEYDRYRPMNKEEYRQLYGLLLFPEKFWKVTNHYMNSRKTWMSGREIDKLSKVIEQETLRLIFMENLFAFLK